MTTMRPLLASCLLLAACESTVPAPSAYGEWGIEAGPPCPLYALARISGDADGFSGAAFVEDGSAPSPVTVNGDRRTVLVGAAALTITASFWNQPGPSLRGTYHCDSGTGAWSMFRYHVDWMRP